jgi:hypothetical protein
MLDGERKQLSKKLGLETVKTEICVERGRRLILRGREEKKRWGHINLSQLPNQHQ